MGSPFDRLRTFLSELKRRQVYRVAVAYAAAAFIVWQAAAIALPALHLPDWTLTLVVVLALVGFPVALVLAWAFEVTPEGVRRTDRAAGSPDDVGSPDDGEPALSMRELPARYVFFRYGLAAAAVLAVAYASLTVTGSIGAEDETAIRSLAVLPPENLSGDPGQEYFVAGMHDALLGELAQIGDLRLISRTSALQYRDTDKTAPEIARELDVDALVEGSVLRAGDSVRIQLQLIGVRPEERHMWARAYHRELRDVLGIHGEVAREIAREIALELTPEESARLAADRTVDPVAYEAYLKGMFHLHKFTPEGFERGLAYLNDAIEADPGDPLPWAGLAAGWALIGHGPSPPPDAFERAEAAAHRALELDSLAASGSARVALAEAWNALVEVNLYADWDWPATERAFRHTLRLNPNLADARAHHSWYLLLQGRPKESLEEMKRARELDPLNPLWPAWRAWIFWWTGRHEEGLEEVRRSLELNPEFPVGLYVLGGLLAAEGRFEEAIEAQRRAGEASPDWRWGLGQVYAAAGRREEALAVAARLAEEPGPIDTWGLAVIHAVLGDEDEALRWLERAHEIRFSWIPWLEFETGFVPLRDHPRFVEMVRRLELPKPRA